MKTSFIFTFIASTILSATASAKPVYLGLLKSEYPQARLTGQCNTCHGGGPRLNPFGQDFFTLKSQFGLGHMKEVWFRLGPMDSDKDGVPNIDELRADTNPGLPKK